MNSVERINYSFTSPVVYYGSTHSSFVIEHGICRDNHGIPLRNERGQVITKNRTIEKDIICPFQNRQAAIMSLKKMYDSVVSRNHKHHYRDFESCVQDVKPECERVNPDLHGVRLVMTPIEE